MRKLMLGLCCLTFVAACTLQTADARPKYYSTFKKTYPDVEGLAETKCGICHPVKSKKVANLYGKALGTALDAKNVKDVEAIKKALKVAEEKESATSDKTFGDLLKDNKLPDPKPAE